MHLWQGLIVVMLGNSIEIFTLDGESEFPKVLRAGRTFTLQNYGCVGDYIVEGNFVSHPLLDQKNSRKSSSARQLHFVARSPDGTSISGTLQMSLNGAVTLLGPRETYDIGKSEEGYMTVMKSFLGSSGGYQLHLTCGEELESDDNTPGSSQQSPSFIVSKIGFQTCPDSNETFEGALIEEGSHVRRDGMPLLHFLSCADFDDGAGLLLFGTLRGEICLGRFIQESFIQGSTSVDFPVHRQWSKQTMMQTVSFTIHHGFCKKANKFYRRKPYRWTLLHFFTCLTWPKIGILPCLEISLDRPSKCGITQIRA